VVFLILVCMGSCAPLRLTNDFDGDIAFFSDREEGPFGPVYIMDAQGHKWKTLPNTRPALPRGLTWSPDGTTVAFEAVLLDEAEYRGVEGIVFAAVSKDEDQRTTYGPCRYSPAWSPDGQFLAFYTDCGDDSSLSIATPEKTRETELVTNLPARVIDGTHYPTRISWSPDSQFLVYDARDEQGNWEIWLVSQDGKSNEFVTVGREPAWSPARDEIAFEREGDIWILSIGTGKEYKLVDDPVRARWPAWSPTGHQLLFVSWRDDSEENRRTTIANTEIYRINRDGTGLLNLTQNPGWDSFPAWRPALSD
jgi:TolB protein